MAGVLRLTRSSMLEVLDSEYVKFARIKGLPERLVVSEGRAVILDVWWLSLLPGLAITVVVLAFNFFGDWMRDTLDPKLRRV